MEIRRCMKCMHELKPGQTSCPECGQAYGRGATNPIALKPGTILDGKYLVGSMLGQGGFGITYIGFDLLLEQKVAIKEYFPMSTGLVSRDDCTNVVWSSAMMEKTGAEKGFDSFLKEARKMAKLKNIPNVVGVNSVFIQNETAYIVMDFIEGETLQKKLEREGSMAFDTCISLLTPIMQALAKVHQHGIIHRDISPDNIMVQKDGKLILLDLGAAKDLDIQKADGTMQSSQLVAKLGFSPFEQYVRNGKIGPWTDVYAMAATVYYCCTGKLPPSAIERMENDTLSCQPLLTKAQFNALAKCMTVSSQNRPQSMDAMLKIVVPALEPKRAAPIKPESPKRKSSLPKWLIPVAAAGIAVLAIGIGMSGRKQPDTAAAKKSTDAQTVPTENTAIQTAPAESTTEQTLSTETAPEETVPVKIHVMAAAAEDLDGLSYDSRRLQPFWGQAQYKRVDVETVTFQSTLEGAPDSAWDVSEAKDQSVLAWMEANALYVAANGKIAPNPNASRMFAYFANLKEIDFGNCFDTSNVTDMSRMFECCYYLTSLDLSGFDTANVTNMANMFVECGSLTSLDLSGFDTANVTNMSRMFCWCRGLTDLDVSGFDTANVTDMGDMFVECGSLTSLDLSGFDTANVTNMSRMFNGCSSLTSLDLSSFDTANVTDMWRMFSDCRSLTSLDLSGFDTANVTNMSRMFNGCSSLTSLDVSGFDTANVTDMRSMFSMCGKLNDLDLSSFNTANATDMRRIFYGCRSLTNLQCSDSKILTHYQYR